jgi:hypothetical protein
MKPRPLLLALALAATLAAAFWPAAEEEAEVVGAVENPRRPPTKPGASTPSPAGTVEVPHTKGALGPSRADLFPAQTWQALAPPTPEPEPESAPPPLPPPPQAPPLPFQYLGRWQEGGKDVYFLEQGTRLVEARVGDSLSGWHFDQATETTLTFTWTALNQRQTLRITP